MALRPSSGLRRVSCPSSSSRVEGIQKHPAVLAPVAQPVEHRQPIAVAGHRLAVDQTGAAGKPSDGCGDCGIAAGPVVPLRVKSRTPAAPLRAMSRKPSCFISCT